MSRIIINNIDILNIYIDFLNYFIDFLNFLTAYSLQPSPSLLASVPLLDKYPVFDTVLKYGYADAA